MAAANSYFIIKNGLAVGTNNVIAANGVWIGSNTGLVGPAGSSGASGITVANTAPSDNTVVWLDTSVPNSSPDSLSPFLLMGA